MLTRRPIIQILLSTTSYNLLTSRTSAFHTSSTHLMSRRDNRGLSAWTSQPKRETRRSTNNAKNSESKGLLSSSNGDNNNDIDSGITPWIDLLKQIFLTEYKPDETATKSFLDRVQEKTSDDGSIKVSVAVLGAQESYDLFGVSMAKRGIQPCWIEIDNTAGDCDVYFSALSVDDNYYTPLEAAMACHFANLKTILSQGILSWMIFLPLAALLPLKLITAKGANEQMNEYFCQQGFPHGLIETGTVKKGFVFTSLDIGTKVVNVALIKPSTTKLEGTSFTFNVPVPREKSKFDYDEKDHLHNYPVSRTEDIVACSEVVLQQKLEDEPRAVSNSRGTKEGDPVNLVIVGTFRELLAAFVTRWDETETVGLQSSIKTVKSFVLGAEYRYSPVSPLYMYGRSQDFALQRARGSINQRLHLRLWKSTMEFEDRPVWVGQVSRDIGVRLAMVFPGTTHKIDPYVDESRDYVLADLIKAGHVDRFGYVNGVGESKAENPRSNLTGDPYVTNGRRVVIVLSPTKNSSPKLFNWGMVKTTT